MNEQETLQSFIKTNFDYLTSSAFEPKGFRRLVSSFYTPIVRRTCGMPNLKAVCGELVSVMLRRGVDPEEVTETIRTLPVFKNIGSGSQDILVERVAGTRATPLLARDGIPLHGAPVSLLVIVKSDSY